MKKTTLFAFLVAMLAPVMSAWATSTSYTYYATLKAEMTSDSMTGSGLVYASTSATEDSSLYGKQPSVTKSAETSDNSASVGSFYAYAEAAPGFQFDGWFEDAAGTGDAKSTDAKYSYGSISSSSTSSPGVIKTVYAKFSVKELDEAFSIMFVGTENGTWTVNGAAPADMPGLKTVTAVTLASSDENFYRWKIGSDYVYPNPHTVNILETTEISAEFLTSAQIKSASSLAELQASLSDSAVIKVNIPSGTEIVIPAGSSVEVPEGKILAVDGTLWVEGTFANKGTISVAGTVAKCTKVVTQTGDNGEPFNPYGNVKYWRTTQANSSASVTGVSNVKSHVTITNGYGVVIRKAYDISSIPAIVCAVDNKVAVNHITAIETYYSSALDAYNGIASGTGYSGPGASTPPGNNPGYSFTASPRLILLTAAGSISVGSKTNIGKTFTIDASEFNITVSGNQINNAAIVLFVNGATATAPKITNGRATFINCTTPTCSGVLNNNDHTSDAGFYDYTASVHLYDCGAMVKHCFEKTTNVFVYKGTGVCIFSGGPYTYATGGNSSSTNFKSALLDCYNLVGGCYTAEPDAKCIPWELQGTHKFYQVGQYWELQEIHDTNVAQFGAEPYESLAEAMADAAKAGSGTVRLLQNVTITDRITIPEEANIRLELAACTVTSTSSDGLFLVNGSLEIDDESEKLSSCGLVAAKGYVIENNGTVVIAYGEYDGNIRLNAGSSFTAYHGTFNGTISTADGVTPTDVADIRGGVYSDASIASFLTGTRSTVAMSSPVKYYVGEFPYAIVAGTAATSGRKWSLRFLESSDTTLYCGSSGRGNYTDAQWYRRAELNSSLEPWVGNRLDCQMSFDRDLAANNVSITAPLAGTKTVNYVSEANKQYSLIVANMTATPWSYGSFIEKYGTSALDFTLTQTSSYNAENDGTVFSLRTQLYSNWNNNLSAPVATGWKADITVCRYMLGGKKAAIDRDGSRVAYDSLAEAVADVQDGETVLVGADTADDVTLPAKAGVFTVDPYGFKFTGEVAAPNGYKIESQVEKASSAYGVESAKAVTYTVVQSAVAKVGDTLYPTLAEAVAAAGGAKITLLADCDEAIVLAEGQMLTLDADGHEFTGTVTAAEGCFATGAADGGTTTWTARKTVATVGDTPYASLDDALAAAGENATLTLKDDVTISAQRTLAVKRLILDGQGHTIGYTKSASRARLMAAKSVTLPDMSASGAVLKFTADATLKDVTIDARDADADAALAYAVEVHGGATLTIENVTLKNGAWYGLHVVGSTVQGSGLAVVNSGFLTDVGLEGASPALKLSGDVAASGQLLFAVDLSDEDEGGNKTATVELPAAFAHYSLDFPELGDDYMGVSLPVEGWTSGDWNDIIETGKAYMSAADVSDDDIASVQVVLGLLDDTTAIPGTFVFEDANFTVNGNGHALSGTIKVTDDAGMLTDIVLGTTDVALTLDLTDVTTLPVALGDGVTAENVTLLLSDEQVASGTTVFTWDAEAADAPSLDGVTISVEGKTLTIDAESGVAYIGPCEARLTGSKTLYTSFADALAQAADSGDTVKLLADIDGVDGTFALNKDIVIDGDGHTIAAAANAEPRNVVQAYSGARVMFDVLSGAVTFKNLTLDGGEGHSYTFLVRAKGGAATFEDATLLNGGEADASGEKGVGYGAAVLADGAAIEVKGAFNACTGGAEDGIFPFTAILYQSGTVHFADGATADIGDDLLLVGMVGAADVSTEEGRAEVDAMLGGMNIPDGFYPYTLSVADNAATSFTGASPRGWNDIIAYGAEIMSVAGSLGLDMDPDTTPVAVGLLADTVLPDTFVFENENFTVNGNGHALVGTIQMTDTAGTLTDIVLGTDEAELTLDLTGVTTLPVSLGDGVTAAKVSLVLTEAQVASGTTVFTWDADGDTPNLDGVTISVDGKELTIDAESGIAYIGPCEARLTGSKTLYTSFADALAQSAASGDTVTLLTDVAASPTIRKNVTIAGAHTLTGVTKVTDGAAVTLSGGITLDAAGQFYALDVAGGASVAVDGAAFAGGIWCNVHLNGGSIAGTGVTMVGDDIVVADDGSSYTYRGATVTDAPFGMNLENVKGQTVTLPFMDIVRENGDEMVSLADADGASLEQGASLLYVANMPGNGSQENVTLPARFGCYTLTIDAGIAFLGDGTTPTTGWTVGAWNDIIDTGIAVLDAIGQDSDTVPVTLTLNGDTVVPGDDGFTFRYPNLTIDGDGHALSGTIVYTDADPGVLQNVVLGADTVLDISAFGADAVRFGADVTVAAGEKAVLVVGELFGGETLAIGRADAPIDADDFVLKMRDADGNLSDAPLPFGYELYVEDGALRLRLTSIVYPTGEQSVGVPIPVAWIHETAGLFVRDAPTADEMATIIERLGTNGANGHPYWQSYVLGLTPNGEFATALRLEAESAGEGELTVRGLNVRVPEDLDAATAVTFRLAKRGADGVWTTVGEAQPMDEATRGAPTFTLDLASVLDGDASNGAVLALFADITTTGK